MRKIYVIYVYIMYVYLYLMLAGFSYLTAHAVYGQDYMFAGIFAAFTIIIWYGSKPFRKIYKNILEDKG